MALPFYSAYMYLYRAFSSLRDLMTVVVVDVVCRIIQIAFYALLVRGVGPVGGIGLPGIPIANTIFYVVMFFILLTILKRRVRQRGAGDVQLMSVAVVAVKTAIASAVGAIVVLGLLMLMGTGTGVLTALLRVVACGVVGLVVTYLLCALLRVREVRQVAGLFGRVARKFKRA